MSKKKLLLLVMGLMAGSLAYASDDLHANSETFSQDEVSAIAINSDSECDSSVADFIDGSSETSALDTTNNVQCSDVPSQKSSMLATLGYIGILATMDAGIAIAEEKVKLFLAKDRTNFFMKGVSGIANFLFAPSKQSLQHVAAKAVIINGMKRFVAPETIDEKIPELFQTDDPDLKNLAWIGNIAFDPFKKAYVRLDRAYEASRKTSYISKQDVKALVQVLLTSYHAKSMFVPLTTSCVQLAKEYPRTAAALALVTCACTACIAYDSVEEDKESVVV